MGGMEHAGAEARVDHFLLGRWCSVAGRRGFWSFCARETDAGRAVLRCRRRLVDVQLWKEPGLPDRGLLPRPFPVEHSVAHKKTFRRSNHRSRTALGQSPVHRTQSGANPGPVFGLGVETKKRCGPLEASIW